MNIFWIILMVAAGYFFVVFVLLRLVAPFMRFGGYQLPTETPEEIKNEIARLENQSQNQMSYLSAVYNFILDKNSKQWKHGPGMAAVRWSRLFVKNLEHIWQTYDFVYCTAINHVVYVMLANSKFFKADDVQVVHQFLNFVPHQYLRVRVGDKWVVVDPAAAGVRGKPLGTHLGWFG